MKLSQKRTLNIALIVIICSLVACSCGINLDLGSKPAKPYVPPTPTYQDEVNKANSNMLVAYASLVVCTIGVLGYLAFKLRSIVFWIASLLIIGIAGFLGFWVLGQATTLLAKDAFSGLVAFGYPVILLFWIFCLAYLQKI